MPIKPAPTDEQITDVVEYASQLHYGFLARPPLGSSGRANWEKRFLNVFSRMLAILAVARFRQLPPFALCCIWENNRRNRVKDPKFNLELIREAYDDTHPGRQEGAPQLSYQAAYEGIFALMPEDAIKNVWWTQSAPRANLAAAIGGDQQRGASLPGVGEEAQTGVLMGDGEMEVDEDAADEHMEVDGAQPDGESEVDEAGDLESAPAEEEGLEEHAVGGASRGRSIRPGKSDAIETRRTTRSSSRGPNPPPAPSQPTSGKGKGKAGRREAAEAATGKGGPSSTKAAGTATTGTKGKAKQRHRGTWTLKDIPAVTISPSPVRHPHPCERCASRGVPCMYSPLVRSGCDDCDSSNAGCSITFKDKKNHLLATYMGYAWYTMLSNPDVYAPPDFGPNQWPGDVPDLEEIAWFAVQYDAQPRGSSARTKRKHARHSGKATGGAASTEDDGAGPAASTADSGDDEQDEQAVVPSQTAHKKMSRPTSAAPPPRPSTAQELPALSSHSTAARRPKRAVASHHKPSKSTIGSHAVAAASKDAAAGSSADGAEDSRAGVEAEPVVQPPSETSYGEDVEPTTESDGDREEYRPYDAEFYNLSMLPQPSFLPSRMRGMETPPSPARKQLAVSNIPAELSRRSTSRTAPPDLPPRPPGASKYVKAPFTVKPIVETWETLPRLGSQLRNGEYAIVKGPHEDPTPGRLQKLLSYCTNDVPVLMRLDEKTADPLPPSVTRPVTPEPRHQFTLSSHVIDLAKTTQVKFNEIADLQYEIKIDTAALHTRSLAVMKRHGDAISQLGPLGEALLVDIQDAFSALKRVNDVLIRLTSGFKSIPNVPWNWLALFDLLTKVDELRDLYATAWSRFDVLEEDLRPVRSEVNRLHHHVAAIQVCLDGIANEAVKACQPLLHNLYSHFTAQVEGIEKRLSRLDGGTVTPAASDEPDVGQVVRAIAKLGERVDQLEKDSGYAQVARIEAIIGTYLADRGLPDDVLRQLGSQFGYPSGPGEVGGSISDALNTVYPPPSTGGHLPQPSTYVQQFRTPLNTVAQGKEQPGTSARSRTSGKSVVGGAQRPDVAEVATHVIPQTAPSQPAVRRARQRQDAAESPSTAVPQARG